MSRCPVCNGMQSLARTCSNCGSGALLEDLGPVDDYYGPYSPYQEQSKEIDPEQQCVHLCRCPECGCERTVPIDGPQ